MTTTLLKLPTYFDDATSRLYCSTIYLDDDLSRRLSADLCNDDLQAVAPAPGVDLVAAARHAARARRLRTHRYLAMVALLGLTIAAIVGSVAAGLGRFTTLVAAGPAVVAYAVHLWFEYRRLSTARQLMFDRAVDVDGAPPLDPAIEERLALANRGNVVVYGAGRDDPFVGSGSPAKNHQVVGPVDVGRPLDGGSTRSFSARQLHDHLAQAIPSMGLEGVTCGDLLYVQGDHAASVPGVLPQPLVAPRCLVSEDVLMAAGRAPGAGARSYLCIRVTGPGALLVATVHVRIGLVRERLSWHMSQHVLTPLPERYRKVLTLGPTVQSAFLRELPHSPGRFLDDFLRSPARLLAEDEMARRTRKRVKRSRKAIKRGFVHDYGANFSVRPSAPDWARTLTLLERNDIRDYLARAVHAVFMATVEFLEAHNVDCYELRKQEAAITNNITADMRGSNFADFGTMENNWAGPAQLGAQPGGKGA